MTADSPVPETFENPEATLSWDFTEDSRTMLLAFSGWIGLMGIPVFEFTRISDSLRTKRIMVRDTKQRRFMMGVPGVGENVDEVAGRLQELIDHAGTERLVTVGNSMGAYGAILYGVLLDADVIQAYVPRTMGAWYRNLHRKDLPQTWKMVLDLNLRYRGPREYFDLRRLLRARPDYSGRIHIHYDSNYRVDRVSAHRLAEFPCVELHEYPYEGHLVIQHESKNGKLRELLEESLHPKG